MCLKLVNTSQGHLQVQHRITAFDPFCFSCQACHYLLAEAVLAIAEVASDPDSDR